MNAATMDYPHLLSEVQPQVIHDEGSNEKFIAYLRQLDKRWDSLSGDEHKLYELISLLNENYERQAYNLHSATPIEVIEELMEANALQRKEYGGSFRNRQHCFGCVKRQAVADGRSH